MVRSSLPRLICLAALLPGLVSAEILDTLSFGNDASQSQHDLSATLSDFKAGGRHFAGRADFYQLNYGPYLIAMNMSADKTFDLNVPEHAGKLTNLVTRKPVESGSVAKVGPRTTVVIFQE